MNHDFAGLETMEQSPRPLTWWISWIVIVLSVGTVMVMPHLRRDAVKQAFEKQSLTTPDVQLLISSRYLVGVERAMPKRAGATTRPGRALAIETLDSHAHTPMDRLRLTIVRGELDGKEAALREIDTLARLHPEVRDDAALLRNCYVEGATADRQSEGWKNFRARHGWFADLAESYGKPDSDPQRAAVLREALHTLVGTVSAVVAVVAAGFIGLAVLIVWIVMVAQRKWPLWLGKGRVLPTERLAYLEAFAIFLGTWLALGAMLKWVLDAPTWLRVALMPVPVISALVWPRLRGQSWAQWRATVGLHTGQGVAKELACGALGYLGGLPVFGVGILITMLLVKISGADTSHPITQEISLDPWRIGALFLLASVWAPIVEELLFRGTLFGHLRGRHGYWISGAVVSLLFAAIHPQGWAAIPALGSLAMVLAGIREWRGSILGCMMAHAINNTLVLIVLVCVLA